MFRPDPKKEAEKKADEDEKKRQEKVKSLLEDGWAALKAEDAAAAVDAFQDALELKPDTAEAHLGIGLARAYEAKWSAATAEFNKAMKDKAFERLAYYNESVVETRISQRNRAAVTLNGYLAKHTKPVEKPVESRIGL